MGGKPPTTILTDEADESFEERMTKVGGKPIYNLPIERHAAQIYTRKLFALFSRMIFESGQFVAQEIIPNIRYIVKHVNAEKRQSWEKTEFSIDVISNGDQYICECGLSEHMGMMCAHIIRVCIQLGVQTIPAKHIAKRWTLNARDMLPPHLVHYQKDQAAIQCQSIRHSSLYKAALEIVHLGDSNPRAFEIAMKYMLQAKTELLEFGGLRDGHSLAEQLANNTAGTETLTNATDGELGIDAVATILALEKNESADTQAFSVTSLRMRRERNVVEL
ncbi:hypothetical protein ACP4OV_004049 [Aristida adscensionis]